jgi:hypothetical protein
VIHAWKAEHSDPDKLLKSYKENGEKFSSRSPITTTTWIKD